MTGFTALKMTRVRYDSCVPARLAEVYRLLDRYLVEIVETYDLCPWAKSARLNGELAREVLWGQPSLDTWVETATRLLAGPKTRVVMVIAPEFRGSPKDFRDVRSHIAAQISTAGVAEFHPSADLDLATPSRLVRFLRRSPDPLIQLVPLSILDSLRTGDRIHVDMLDQQALLRGELVLPVDIGEKIADTNHATVLANTDAVIAQLADIAADRMQSYARVGIQV
jgi:hypothetical protein